MHQFSIFFFNDTTTVYDCRLIKYVDQVHLMQQNQAYRWGYKTIRPTGEIIKKLGLQVRIKWNQAYRWGYKTLRPTGEIKMKLGLLVRMKR